MRYAQHRSSVRHRRSTKRGSAKRFFSLAFLLVIGFGAYSIWRTSSTVASTTVENTVTQPVGEVEDQLKEVTEKVVALAIPGSVDAAEVAAPAIDATTSAPVETGEIIELSYLEVGAGYSTTVKRDLIEGQFVLTALATLPFVDDATATYEVWLVKPGVTDFFSVGNMYRREDGRWGLVWKVDPQAFEKNVRDFTRVIVTREPRDGVGSPSTAHVMQGDFTQP